MDFKRQKPIYLQIADQLCERMLQGEWQEGGRMASVRDVAAGLGVNPNTVQRAFAWLEEQGIIASQRGIGYFLAGNACSIIRQKKRDEFIHEEWPEVLRRMEVLGLTLSDLAKRALVVLLLVLGGAGAAFAQSYTVSGTLVEGTYNVGIPYANVGLFRAADTVFMRGATTQDMTGAFAIQDVAAGEYLLKVVAPGFPAYWQELTVEGDLKLDPIEMTVNLKELKEVMITARRPLYAMDGEKNLYNTSDDPTIQGGTAADALRSAPGVEVDMQGNVSLRGVASVEIWINGQPSHLDQESLRQYLKTLPASSIQRIEVITNPSARYSSKGGVINIVTSQRIMRNDFLSLSLMGNAREGVKPDFNPWVSYVHSNEKMTLNLYGSPRYGFDKSRGDGFSTKRNELMQPIDSLWTSSQSSSSRLGYFAGGDLDWNIDSMTSLNMYIGAYGNRSRMEGLDSSQRFFFGASPDWLYSDLSLDTTRYNGFWSGVDFTHRFDTNGRRIDLNLSLGGNNSENSTLNRRDMWSDPSLSFAHFNQYLNRSYNLGLDANYSHPFSQTLEMELGASYEYATENEGIEWRLPVELDSLRSYESHNQGHEIAAYGTLQKRWGNLTMKLGLRGEERIKQLNYSGYMLYDTTHAYFNLVPSIHLTYRTEKMDNFKLNYTFRSSDPKASQLTAFRQYGLEGYSVGNPALLCSYTHNLEAGWTRFMPKLGSLGVEAYFKGNTNEIQSLADVVVDENFLYSPLGYCSMPVNIGASYTLGGQLNAMFRPGGMMTIKLDANVFYNHYRYDLRGEGMQEIGKMAWSLRGYAWMKVWKKVDIFAMAMYSSPTQRLYSVSSDWKTFDIGFSGDFLDRRLSVFCGISDLFNWNAFTTENLNPYLTTSQVEKQSTRGVRFGLTWKLGKMELEAHAKGQQQ